MTRASRVPSRGRKLLFIALTLTLTVVVTEVGARIVMALTDSYAGAAARAHARAEAGRDPEDAPIGGRAAGQPTTRGDIGIASRGTVVHPYYGYVRDPAAPREYWTVGPDGFFMEDPPADGVKSDDGGAPIRVAILGGSFANHLAFAARTPIKGHVTGLARRRGATVEVHSLAMGGYKQPQQLHILAGKLVNGARYDLVINVDGFNEAVLPFDNLRLGLAPTYPMTWPDLVGGLPDVDAQLLAGEIAFLRQRRRARAGMCDGIFSSSAFCHLLWQARDRWLAKRLATLEERRAAARAGTRRFEIFGPETAPVDRESRIEQMVALWREGSRAIDTLTRSYGIPYVHVLQPNQYLPGAKVLTAEERAIAFAPRASHRPYVESVYPRLRAEGERLRQEGVRFIDMSMAFAETEESVFADTCCHLTRRGYFLFGKMLGKRLIDTLGRIHLRDHEQAPVPAPVPIRDRRPVQ